MSRQPRRITVYVDAPTLAELEREATRLDRTVSWILRRAWSLSRDRIVSMPSQREPVEGVR